MITQSAITLSEFDKNSVLDYMNKYGVVILPNYIQGENLEVLNQEFDTILKDGDTSFQQRTPYSNGACVRMNRVEMGTHYEKTAEVFSDSFMDQLTKSYLGEKGELNTQIFVVKDIVGTRHMANDLHFDVIPTFKFFLYLTDTTAENGAFTCVPTSHLRTKEIREKLGDKISFKNRELSRDLPYEASEQVSIEGKAGTLIIFTTETFHKAGIVSNGERRVMRGHCRVPNVQEKKSLVKKIFSRLKI